MITGTGVVVGGIGSVPNKQLHCRAYWKGTDSLTGTRQM